MLRQRWPPPSIGKSNEKARCFTFMLHNGNYVNVDSRCFQPMEIPEGQFLFHILRYNRRLCNKVQDGRSGQCYIDYIN